MGGRRDTRDACEIERSVITPKGRAIKVIESECIKGTESDYRGNETEFWQAYVFYLKDESAANKDQAVPVFQPSVSDSTKGKDLPLDENEKAKRNFINSSKTLPR